MSQVQWFPGHMTRAKRKIEEQLKRVDMVIECRDARAPLASRNPLLDQLIQDKPRLIVLTKRDLAPASGVSEWVKALSGSTQTVISVDIFNDQIKPVLEQASLQVMAPKHERDLKRGIKPRAIRALIVGIPNVGKSTLINRLAKRKVVRVENRPGITQALKLIKVSGVLEIVDSPGMLWPKFEDQQTGVILSLIGSVKDTGYPLDLVSDTAIGYLKDHHVAVFFERYNLPPDASANAIYEGIAEKRGFYLNGIPDLEKARQCVVTEISNGVYGQTLWENADEN